MVYLIIGRREQGKTTLAYRMASKLPRRLIFDPRGMIGGKRVMTGSDLQAACDRLADGEIQEVIHTPFGDAQAGFVQFASEAQRWVLEYPDQPLAILVDELAFVDTKVVAFQWAMRCCKRDTIHILMTAHRPADVQTYIRALVDHWCLFAMRQEHDLDVIKERCSVDVYTAVQALEPRCFVQWDDAHSTSKLYTDPASWYIELQPERPGSGLSGPQGLDDLPSRDVATTARVDTTPKLF